MVLGSGSAWHVSGVGLAMAKLAELPQLRGSGTAPLPMGAQPALGVNEAPGTQKTVELRRSARSPSYMAASPLAPSALCASHASFRPLSKLPQVHFVVGSVPLCINGELLGLHVGGSICASMAL